MSGYIGKSRSAAIVDTTHIATKDYVDTAVGGFSTALSGLDDVTISSVDPTVTENLGTGHVWLNTTTPEFFVCTDGTTDKNFWVTTGLGSKTVLPFTATGGTVTEVNGYKYHTFTSSGTFTVTEGSNSVDYLVVAGGGGGSVDSYNDRASGGGGAGGYLSGTVEVDETTANYSITIGGGGSGGIHSSGSAVRGTNGSNTTAFGLTAIGGGAGAGHSSASPYNFPAYSGGSGGGSNHDTTTYGTGTVGQGNRGGGQNQMQGGVGLQWLNGQYYAGGGAGSASSGNYYAGGGGGAGGQGVGGSFNGGLGGGGNSGQSTGSVTGTSGAANTGGGGGASRETTAGSGGSGIVIVRYQA